MEAELNRVVRRLFVTTILVMTCVAGATTQGANFRTQNFLIQAPTPQLARAVGEAAEKYRHELAEHWLGQPLRPWPTPCPVRVVAGPTLAAQGVTTYNRSPVRDFQMEVVGTPERILDSVLPHEVTHTILATHFGRPLPRWADEGICTTVEHESERNKHEAKLREFLRSRRGIAMNQLFLLTEYPSDVLPMYAQGYSVCRFLIEQKDPKTFVAFLRDYMQHPSWTANIKRHYGYDSLAELQDYWLAWVAAGSGPVEKFAKNPIPKYDRSLASNLQQDTSPANQPVALMAATNTPAPARDAPASTALASNLSTDRSSEVEGWYTRQRNRVQQTDTRLAREPNIATPMAPPSVRNSGRYKSAQPQPEMRIARGGKALVQ